MFGRYNFEEHWENHRDAIQLLLNYGWKIDKRYLVGARLVQNKRMDFLSELFHQHFTNIATKKLLIKTNFKRIFIHLCKNSNDDLIQLILAYSFWHYEVK